MLLAALARLLPRERWAVVLVTPSTLLHDLGATHHSRQAHGYAGLPALFTIHGDTAALPIPVAIETPRGLLVACLRTSGRSVFAINPLGAVARPTESAACWTRAGKPMVGLARRTGVTPRLVAEGWIGMGVVEVPAATWDADEAVTRLFGAHYRQLVRFAALLLRDRGRAEEIVQDAYVGLHARWWRLRDPDKALAYLRASVVNRSRSALRQLKVVDRHAQARRPLPEAPNAEARAFGALEHPAVVAALQRLPARQGEALVLRYYVDLSEAEIAEAMGVSRGAVKSHVSRGVAALGAALGEGQP